jgi:hypothetical protein
MQQVVMKLVRMVLGYVGSSWVRAAILAFLGTWALMLEVLYRHQDAVVRAVFGA